MGIELSTLSPVMSSTADLYNVTVTSPAQIRAQEFRSIDQQIQVRRLGDDGLTQPQAQEVLDNVLTKDPDVVAELNEAWKNDPAYDSEKSPPPEFKAGLYEHADGTKVTESEYKKLREYAMAPAEGPEGRSELFGDAVSANSRNRWIGTGLKALPQLTTQIATILNDKKKDEQYDRDMEQITKNTQRQIAAQG